MRVAADGTAPHGVTRALADAQRCLLPLEEAWSLPPAAFNDEDWYRLECERALHAGWVAVARSSQLAEANAYVTASIAGEPCVVVRDRNGSLRALSNVCPHRSVTIMNEPSGSAPSFQCPYHQWTFGHDGGLRSAPGMDQAVDFDRSAHCLATLAVEEWQGFVLVNVDGAASAFAESVPTLNSFFAEQRVDEYVSVGQLQFPSPWNWKVSVENFLESYHHRAVHPETLEPTYPGAKSFASFAGDEPWSGVDHVCVVEDHDPFIALSAYPTLLVAVSRGLGAYWFRVEPLAADATMLTIELLLLPEFATVDGIAEEMLESVERINDEDVVINEQTAAGLRSRFARPGRVSHLEGSPWHFRQWLIRRMTEAVES